MLQEASANDAVAGVEAMQYQPPKCWEEEALQGVAEEEEQHKQGEKEAEKE